MNEGNEDGKEVGIVSKMERSIFIHRSIIVVMTDPSSASLSLQLLNNKNSYLFGIFSFAFSSPDHTDFFGRF